MLLCHRCLSNVHELPVDVELPLSPHMALHFIAGARVPVNVWVCGVEGISFERGRAAICHLLGELVRANCRLALVILGLVLFPHIFLLLLIDLAEDIGTK